MRNFVKTSTVLALILLPMFASACNTMAGAGKDTKAAGQAVEDSADKNK